MNSTDVAANVRFSSDKKLICDAFRKTLKQVFKFDKDLATAAIKDFEEENMLNNFIFTYDELQDN